MARRVAAASTRAPAASLPPRPRPLPRATARPRLAAFQTRQRGPDFTGCGHDGPPKRGGGFVESRFGQRDIAASTATLEHWREQVHGQVPEPLIGVEPLAGVRARQADGTREGQGWQQFGTAGANEVPRRRHPFARRANVRPLQQQLRRDARRNRLHGCDGWQSIGQPQLKVLAVASQQHPQPSVGIGQTTLDSRQLGLRVNEKTSRLVETVNVGQAAARAALRLRPQKSTS